MPARPRFSADEMLGSLARWLRIMGYDTTYEKGRGDNEILASSRSEGRVLLTRDEELAQRGAPSSLYVRSDDLDEQLRQVASAFGLAADEAMARCTVCNGELDLLPREEAEGRVPLGALESNEEFFRCDSCGKVYWKGSHWDNIRRRLEGLGDQMR
jgi:hypothetical protein